MRLLYRLPALYHLLYSLDALFVPIHRDEARLFR